MTDKKMIDKASTHDGTVRWLEHEISVANDRIIYLQNELDHVSSLKMHIKHYALKKMKYLDNKVEKRLQPQTNFMPINSLTGNDILDRAHRTDQLNLDTFNAGFTTNTQLTLYRNVKSGVKKIIRNKKSA